MQYRLLGSTGVHVSALTLGTMSFGALGNADHDDCVRIVHRALDAGINSIDTADVYSQGESERICAKALHARRDDVVLSTKCFWPMGADPNRRGLSRRWIVRACEESLRRLETDWIDVYHLHKPDLHTDLDETLGAMDDLVRSGKVRMVATSTFPADLLVEAQWVAAERAYVRPRVEQPPYSVFARGIEREVLPACQRHGMGVLVWGPLNSGWLSGKYNAGSIPAGSRGERWSSRQGRAWQSDRAPVQRKLEVLAELSDLARANGISLLTLALAFATEHPAVSSAIIGPRTMQQLDDQLPAADARLTAEVLDVIDALVPPGTNVDHDSDAGWVPPWISDATQRRRT
jgi:aryl-alcohol dehydrogenase-like predicted oxidoreductase